MASSKEHDGKQMRFFDYGIPKPKKTKKDIPSDERVSSTAERLQFYLQKHNLKQVDIARMCQPLCEKYNIRLQRNDINQYVRGIARPSPDRLTILSKALGVPEIWLLGYNIPQNIPISETFIENEKTTKNKRITDSGIEYDFKAKLKYGSLCDDNTNDIVYFKKQKTADNGDLVAVILDKKPSIKRVYYYKDKKIVIFKSSNPDEDIIYDINDPNFYIVGKAVAYTSNRVDLIK